MEKKWYALYTRQHAEKKISATLNGKGIENFYPLNSTTLQKNLSRRKMVVPLFSTYLFAYLNEIEMKEIHKIHEIRFIYWMSKPVEIDEQEIDLIKTLSTHYMNISLEKIPVRVGEPACILDNFGSALPFSYPKLKVKLPTLGYIATGERKPVYSEEETLIVAPPQFNLLSRKLTSLFT